MELKVIKIEKPDEMNFIVGHSHFIKTIEDIYEVMIGSMPNIKFGIGFCESSGPCLVRYEGNDEKLIELAKKNALNIGAGHAFIIFMENAYPINVLNSIKSVPEVCRIFCATANKTEVVIGETEKGRAILGVIDGSISKGIESEEDIKFRKDLLRKIGYKL